MEATVKPLKELFIYDDVPACADGTLIAHVFENGKEIETAALVFPICGVSEKTKLVGMGLSGGTKNKRHTVTFTEGDLCLIEK